MKNYKGFHYYIVMAVGIATALLLIYPLEIKAEVTNSSNIGYYYYTEVLDDLSMTENPTRYSYSTHYEVDIWTNDPTCYGTLTIPLSGSVTVRFAGTYSHVTLQGARQVDVSTYPTLSKGGRAFTYTDTETSIELVQINPIQLQALLDAINNNGAPSLSTIEATLDVIKDSLISINVNTENNEGESYLRLINELLNNQLPTYKTLLTNISNNTSNIYSQLSSIRQTLNTINTHVNQLNNKFPSDYGNSVLTKLDTLDATCNAIITAINTDFQHLEDNIDNLIDYISWNKLFYTFKYTTDFNTINDATLNFPTTENCYYLITFPNNEYVYKNISIYKITIYSDNLNDFDYEFGFYRNGKFDILEPLYIQQDRYKYDIYFTFTDTKFLLSSPYYLYIKYDKTRNFKPDYSGFYYIDNNDIEFWHLLYYMKSFNYYQRTLDHQNDTNNAINNLQNSFNTLNQFEQQQTESFENALGDIDMNLDFDTAIPDFTNTLSYFKTVNETIINEIPMVKYIVFIILIVLIWGLLT